MPPEFDVSRLSAARARLLSHPALESAPRASAQFAPTSPRLLHVLCALTERRQPGLHGLDASLLADRASLAAVARAPTLADERWRALLAKGGEIAPLTDRALLHSVTHTPFKLYSPSANAVDDALEAAGAAHRALTRARRHARESKRLVDAATAAEVARRKETSLPAHWTNLQARAENPAPPPPPPPPAASAPETPALALPPPPPPPPRRRRPGSAQSLCAFCPDLRHFAGAELDSELLGPFVNARGRAALHVHFDCGCWAPQVFADARTSQFRGVYDEYRRGRQLRCTGCGGKGATVGCYVEKCKRTFHFRCLNGARARKVTEFFAAFCSSHAHLADKELYQLMMRASTIADVATARRESTDGLDAPHSKFTQLRRRDTEIIFSRALRVASHSSAYDSAKSLFSSARRAVLSRGDRLRIKDRVRVVRHSAIDVASGYLALRAAGNPKQGLEDDDICPTEARAAIASRHNSSLMLLRNLERAPCWTTDDIAIAKPARKRSVHFNQRMRARNARPGAVPGADAVDAGSDDERPSAGNEDGADAAAEASRKRKAGELGDDDSPNTRSQAKSRRLSGAAGKTVPRSQLPQSVQMPPSSMNDRLAASLRRSEFPAGPQERRTSVETAKNRGGWDVFLAEQLPRERIVRPEDGIDEAMANMARMWSLLPAAERAEYETRASSDVPTGTAAKTVVQPPRVQEALHTRRGAVSAGLFGVKPSNQGDSSNDDDRNSGSRTKPLKLQQQQQQQQQQHRPSESNGASTFALSTQRRKWRSSRRNGGGITPDETVPPNWDDIFPADLSCALPSAPGSAPTPGGGEDEVVENASGSASHVLPAPTSKKR